jgi:HK97 family phage portal protein
MRFGPFEIINRKSLADPEAALLALFGIQPTTASGATVTAVTALEVPAVAAAVRIISEAAATLSVMVKQAGPDGIESDVSDHPAQVLLRGMVNDWSTGFELIRDLVADALRYDRGGVAWVNWTNGKPAEIIRYLPGVITVDLTRDTGEPVYRVADRDLPLREVIHVRNAFDRSCVSLAKEAIGLAGVMEHHAANLFGRGAKPSGILKTKKALGDEGVKRMLAGWKAAHEGATNAGKTAILWDDAQWEQMQLNSVDSQFHELRLFQVQEIARAFNIPAAMLGDLSRATWSNGEQKGREFLSYCLEPWLCALEGALARALLTEDERREGLVIRFDRDDLTRADLTARATAINSLVAARVLNPNEGRDWLDMAPREGGNEFANPNTGSSQPGNGAPPKDPPNGTP